jgi:hypothetical protein
MEKINLTEEELKELVQLRTDISNMYIQLGQLSLQKSDYLKQIKEQEYEILKTQDELKERERVIYSNIGNKYGEGNVDLESGVFTPIIKE